MVNRYITALLVVLAATGMEAQTYQQALKFALADVSYDELIQQPEAKALEEDILYALKAIKAATSEEQATQEYHLMWAAPGTGNTAILAQDTANVYFYPAGATRHRETYGSIVIRGPNR